MSKQYKRLSINKQLKNDVASCSLPSELGFGVVRTPVMAIAKYENGEWGEASLRPWQAIELDPSAKALHYGQAIFEGMKCYNHTEGPPVLFRPLENFARFNRSADRMAMPEISEDIFMSCVESVIYHQTSLIPRGKGESLYIRPFMIASGLGIGLAPSTEYLFMVIASPSGAYFANDSVSVLIERKACRAAPGGTGAAKAAGNYAGSIKSSIKARKLGYQQTLWLNAAGHQFCEELSGMNFFAVINGDLYTPKLTDTILAGITRDSIIQLARDINISVNEVSLSVDELIGQIESQDCTELFACGTAAVVTPIAELGEEDGTKYPVKHSYGPISKRLRDMLTGIQEDNQPAPEGWVHEIEKQP